MMNKNTIKQTLWLYIISSGTLVTHLESDEESWSPSTRISEFWDYFGGTQQVNYKSIVDFTGDESSIDWDLTQNPFDNICYEFCGTEQPSTETPTLAGTLHMQNGKRYCWIIKFDVDIKDIISVLELVQKFENKTELDVLTKSKKRYIKALESIEKKLAENSRYIISDSQKESYRETEISREVRTC